MVVLQLFVYIIDSSSFGDSDEKYLCLPSMYTLLHKYLCLIRPSTYSPICHVGTYTIIWICGAGQWLCRQLLLKHLHQYLIKANCFKTFYYTFDTCFEAIFRSSDQTKCCKNIFLNSFLLSLRSKVDIYICYRTFFLECFLQKRLK